MSKSFIYNNNKNLSKGNSRKKIVIYLIILSLILSIYVPIVNSANEPYFITLDLEQSINMTDWSEVSGNLSNGFLMELNSSVQYYYLNCGNDTTTNISIAEGNYGFYVNASEQNLTYWNNKGVNASSQSGTWMAHMWQILIGIEPIFYLNVSASQDFMLIDGLSLDFVGVVQYLRVNGDYPLGTYHYNGTVLGVNNVSSDPIIVEMTFTDMSDTNAPNISNLDAQPSPQLIGGFVNISCDVTDDVAVDTVLVNITGPSGFTTINTTMNDGYYYNSSYTIMGTYDYYIWANDTNGNSVTSSSSFIINNNSDDRPPEIDNILALPDYQVVGGFVNISCDVTDNVAVDIVTVNITDPYGYSLINATMNGSDHYYFERTYDVIGIYHYTIWTRDINNNSNISFIYTFEISDTYDSNATVYSITELNANKAYHTGDGYTQGEFEDIGGNTPLDPNNEQYSEHDSIEYSNIESNENQRNSWISYDFGDDELPENNWINLWYQFTIFEVVNTITGIQVLWNGHDELDDGGNFEFDIWNYTSSSWEVIESTGVGRSSDHTYVGTLTENIENYISPSHKLSLGISGEKTPNTGSGCAFVYSFDGEKYYPEHAISDFAVHKLWEYPSYGLLPNMKKLGDHWEMAIWEQVPETQYIDTLQLWKVIHNSSVEIVPEQTTGTIHTISNKIHPVEVWGSDNRSYKEELSTHDEKYWVTNTSNLNFSKPRMWDSLDLSFKINNNKNNLIKLVIRGKETGMLSETWRSMVTAIEGNVKDYNILNSNMSIFKNVSDWVQNNGLLYIYQKINGQYQYIGNMMFGNTEFYHTWSMVLEETKDEKIELRIVGAPYAHMIDEIYIDTSSDISIDIVKMNATITNSNKDNISTIENKINYRDFDYFEMDYDDYIHCSFYDNSTIDKNKKVTTLVYADAYSESYAFKNNSRHLINKQNLSLAKEIWSSDGLERELLLESFFENNSITTKMNSCKKVPHNTLFEDYVEVRVSTGLVDDPSWWSMFWENRKLITIDHNMINQDLYNFPVLISLDQDEDLADHSQNNGDDIVFVLYSDNNTQLNHEIEFFDDQGNLSAWVNIPFLRNDKDTKIWLYYNNPTCENQENISGTWNSNYMVVHHLNETQGIHIDSTSNKNNGICYGGVNQSIEGKIDGADTFDGDDDFINISDNNSLDITDSITIEAWIKSTNISSVSTVITKEYDGNNVPYRIDLGSSSSINGFGFFDGSWRTTGLSGNENNGQWHQIVGSYDGNTLRYYCDGNVVDSVSYTGSIPENNESLFIGRYQSYYYNGSIDEVRISNVQRSSDWINTSYQNQHNPNDFYNLSNEEKINLHPSANFIYEPGNPTSLDIIYFNSTSFDPDGDIVNWTWDFGDGNISYDSNTTHQYDNNGDYIVTLTIRDDYNAVDSIEQNITVYNCQPISNFSIEPLEPSIDDIIYFNSTSFDPDGDIVNWTWDFGDGNHSYTENTTHQFSEIGTYLINLSVRDDDGDLQSTILYLYVGNLKPSVNFTYEPIYMSISDIIYFNSTSFDPDGDIVNWTWDFGDGNVSFDEYSTHQYTVNGTYIVNLTVTDNDGAINSTEKVLFIGNYIPIADFTYEPMISSAFDTIYFNSTSYDIDGSIVNWTWDFNDGSFGYGENVTHQYTVNGSYVVNLTVTDDDGAVNYSEQNVCIGNWLPHVFFTYEPEFILPFETVYFNSTSYDFDGSIVNWTWDFGDGYHSYTENTTHQYANNDTCLVRLTVTDDYGDSTFLEKSVYIGNWIPYTNFTIEPIEPSYFESIYFNSTSYDPDGSIVNWTWDFDDGSIGYGENITHQYIVNGTFVVKLTVTDDDGAVNYSEQSLRVGNFHPITYFYFEPTNPYTFDTIYFNSTSYDIDGYVVNWTWDFNDGSFGYGENVTHQYTEDNNYSVRITVKDNDNATGYYQQDIIVANRDPEIYYTIEPIEPVCYETVYFNSTSFDPDGDIVNWTWDFGDGNYSYNENTTHQYSCNGTYIVNLTIADDDGAVNYSEQSILIGNILPIANFTYEPIHPSASEIIYFNSTSFDPDGNIVNWTWDFGDGNVSFDENTTHIYYVNGEVIVNLTVTDNMGETANTSKIINLGGELVTNITLSWNLISIPFNESINKTDLIVRNNETDYNWSEAISVGLVNQFFFGWNRTTGGYTIDDILQPGYGYWMYAYDTCELYIKDVQVNMDSYITDITLSWNLIGIPFNQALNKNNISIGYNSSFYNWSEAVSVGLVNQFFFGWNRTTGGYSIDDILQPGYGYWMYAYIDCNMIKTIS